MPYIGNITQDFNVSNAMLDTDSVTSIKIVDGTIEGADIAANLDLSDSQKIRFGAGNDLQIYHDGSNSYIDDTGTGDLNISGSIVRLQDSNRLTYCRGVQGGAFEIYFNNALKFETTSTGATVTGALATTSLSATGGITGTGGNFILGDSSGTSDDRIKLGAGGDLHVYHDGTDTYVSNATGDLRLFSVGGSADDVTIRAQDDIQLQPDNGDNGVNIIGNGAVELYYDNSKKFETTSSGVSVTGALSSTNFNSINLSASVNHIQWPQDASASNSRNFNIIGEQGAYGVLDVKYSNARDENPNEKSIRFIANGGVELYYDNSKKLQTTANGIELPSSQSIFLGGKIDMTDSASTSTGRILLGTGDDLQLYHDGSNSFVQHVGTGGLYIDSLNNSADLVFRSQDNINMFTNSASQSAIDCVGNGGVLLYHQGTKKFETTSGGATVTGDLTTGQLFIGDGGPGNTDDNICVGDSKDLKIYHDGNSTLYDNGAGNFKLYSNGGAIELQKDTGENMGVFTTDGAVTLYFDNSSKLVTQSTGVRVNSTGSSHGLYVHHSNGNEVARLAHNGSGDEGVMVLRDGGSTTISLNGEVGQNCTIAGPNAVIFGNTSGPGTSQRGCSISAVTTGNPVFIQSSSVHYTDGAYSHWFIYDDHGLVGRVTANGDGTVSYVSISDYRLKENVVPITDGIAKLKTLKPYRFNFKTTDASKVVQGFFAHEVSEACPNAVDGNKDEMKSLYYEEGDTIPDGKEVGDFKEFSTTEINPQGLDVAKLVPLLVAALQEEISNRETLEARVAALEAA